MFTASNGLYISSAPKPIVTIPSSSATHHLSYFSLYSSAACSTLCPPCTAIIAPITTGIMRISTLGSKIIHPPSTSSTIPASILIWDRSDPSFLTKNVIRFAAPVKASTHPNPIHTNLEEISGHTTRVIPNSTHSTADIR